MIPLWSLLHCATCDQLTVLLTPAVPCPPPPDTLHRMTRVLCRRRRRISNINGRVCIQPLSHIWWFLPQFRTDNCNHCNVLQCTLCCCYLVLSQESVSGTSVTGATSSSRMRRGTGHCVLAYNRGGTQGRENKEYGLEIYRHVLLKYLFPAFLLHQFLVNHAVSPSHKHAQIPTINLRTLIRSNFSFGIHNIFTLSGRSDLDWGFLVFDGRHQTLHCCHLLLQFPGSSIQLELTSDNETGEKAGESFYWNVEIEKSWSSDDCWCNKQY